MRAEPVIEVVPARAAHLRSIARRMRAADRDEVFAASGRSPLASLTYSLRHSAVAWVALIDGRPEVIFGVADLNVLARVGAPWLLGTDAVTLHRTAFLRGSVDWRRQLLARYDRLRNLVDDRNVASKRWLSWLGFTLSEPVPIGHEGVAFRLFELRRGDV